MTIFNQSAKIEKMFESIKGVWWVKKEAGEYNVYLNDDSSYINGATAEKLGSDHIYGESWMETYNKLSSQNHDYKETLDKNKSQFMDVLNGTIKKASYRGPWLDDNGRIIFLEHQVFCIESDTDGSSRIVVGLTINDSEKANVKSLYSDLEELTKHLQLANEHAVDLANLLVWTIDYDKVKDGSLFLCNKQYQTVLGLENDEYGFVRFSDFIKSQYPDEHGETSMKFLLEEFDKTQDNKQDEFLKIVVKHQNLITNEVVYLEHYTRVEERYIDGRLKRIGGYIVDITERVSMEETNRLLNEENSRLLSANKLAVKSGKVMIWYINYETMEHGTGYGNALLFEKLGIEATNKHFFKISDFQGTVVTDDEEGVELAKVYLEKQDLVRANKLQTFDHVLVKHRNKKTKEIFYLEHSFESEKRDDSGLLNIRGGFMMDVTAETLSKKKIEYLLYHDVITGLYNRHAFEEYNQKDKLPKEYSLILSDIDGLKFINDAFGHMQGDSAIMEFGHLLHTSFEKDKCFRIGGDEFAVITKNIDEKALYEKLEHIKKQLSEKRDNTFVFNFSYGFGSNDSGENSFNEVFRFAENIMYRRKLSERNSRKSKTLETVLETLNVKTEETKDHCDRLSSLAVETMKSLGYIRLYEHDDMKLLCRVHDVGKITISEEILSAPRSLTKDEYIKIQSHSEAGYKIVRNIVDSDKIAEGVLYHHERYDGHGYPFGLAGEDIPLYARLLCVVDAYDVMVTGRSYKDAISIDDAVVELRSCSGTQFDPIIVEKFIEVIKKGS